MSRKNLIKAIGNIDDEFVEEYASYNHADRIKTKRLHAFQILAACAVLAIIIGVWSYQYGKMSPQENPTTPIAQQENITQRPETAKPHETNTLHETTKPNENGKSIGTSIANGNYNPNGNNNADVNDNNPNGTEDVNGSYELNENYDAAGNQTDPPDNQIIDHSDSTATAQPNLPATNQPSPPTTKPPTDLPNTTKTPIQNAQNVTYINWLEITADATPHDALIYRNISSQSLLPGTYIGPEFPTETAAPANTQTPSAETALPNITDAPASVDPPDVIQPAGDNDASSSSSEAIMQKINDAHAISGWCWFDESDYPITNGRFSYAHDGATEQLYAHFISIYEGESLGNLYLLQKKYETPYSLEKMNRLYPEEIFSQSTLSYINGRPLYLVMSQEGRIYARMMVNNIFVTVWADQMSQEKFLQIIEQIHYVN